MAYSLGFFLAIAFLNLSAKFKSKPPHSGICTNCIYGTNVAFEIPSKNETNGNGKRSNAVPNNNIDAYEN